MVTMGDRNDAVEQCPEDEEESLGSLKSDSLDDEESAVMENTEKQEELKIAKGEDKVVWRLRLVVALVLIGAAVSICLVAYVQGRNSEQQTFEQAFEELGGKLVSGFEDTMKIRVGLVEGFSMDLTSYANDNANLTWPFVTPPDFARRASHVGKLTKSPGILFMPKVATEQKQEWEAFAQSNSGWMQEAVAMQEGVKLEEVKPVQFLPFMFGIRDGRLTPETGEGPYFPVWTSSRVSGKPLTNLNPYSNPDVGRIFIDAVLASESFAFPKTEDFFSLTEEEKAEHQLIQQLRDAFPDLEYNGEPFMSWYYPVFDSHNTETREIVALLNVGIIWQTLFENILPEGTKELLVVLENECGQAYTIHVAGPNASVHVAKDTHSSKYDYLELGTNVDSIVGLEESDVTAKEINTGNCHYSIRVYPSLEFENSYHSIAPLLYTIALASVFLFTCAIFLIYDFMVEHRQKVVMKSAQQSGKLVHSLFPEEVRNQLYQEEEEAKAKQKHKEQGAWLNNQAQATEDLTAKQAIANLYPETTIFFCDLAGFTKWSSTRTPTEVFELLEALYGEFDAIAAKFNVFKVETIGDCYVAITGIPNPQPEHAVIMVKFARSCMSRLHMVTASLAEKLGDDTLDLEMRVGLHSGPVTAGVLRGKKARFQLFGDSVNTASRMESNGMKGRIHVSEATAHELRVRGLEKWLTQREDKIIAKGKGEMTTYWVTPKSSCSTRSGDRTSLNSFGASFRVSDLGEEVATIGSQPEPSESVVHGFVEV